MPNKHPTFNPKRIGPRHRPAGSEVSASQRADTQRFYGSNVWKRIRRTYLMEHPLCVMCHAGGHTVAASVVDHIRPINQGGDPYDPSNVQSLCRHHHSQKTLLESRNFNS